MTKVLVTGVADFIGSNVVSLPATEVFDPVVLDNLVTDYGKNLSGSRSLSIVEGEVRDAGLVSQLMDGVDVICHLAASVGNTRSIKNPIEDTEVNVIGMLQLLDAAHRARVSNIVCSSSAAILGALKSLPTAEDHPAEPDSPCSISKLLEEKHCLAYARLDELESISQRDRGFRRGR